MCIAVSLETSKTVLGPAPRNVIEVRSASVPSMRYVPAGMETTWPAGHASIAAWIGATALAPPVRSAL